LKTKYDPFFRPNFTKFRTSPHRSRKPAAAFLSTAHFFITGNKKRRICRRFLLWSAKISAARTKKLLFFHDFSGQKKGMCGCYVAVIVFKLLKTRYLFLKTSFFEPKRQRHNTDVFRQVFHVVAMGKIGVAVMWLLFSKSTKFSGEQ